MKTFGFSLCCAFFFMFFILDNLSAQCPSGQKQLNITVKTDNYPNETTWVLFDYLSNVVLSNGGPYATANNTYTNIVCVPNNSTLRFIIYDSYGDGLCCSTGSGFYNVKSGSTTLISGASFGSQEIKIFAATPQSKDLLVNEITLPENGFAGTKQVQGKITNIGTTTISGFNLNYRVNGGTTQTQTGVSTSISPGSEYSFTHSFPWLVDFGSNTLEVWASNPDGNTDMNTANDKKEKIINGLYELGDRTVLIEHFTNASCGPCAANNPGLFSVLNNAANMGKYAHVSYHTSWPGYDPMNSQNTADPNARKTFYNVSGVPNVVMEGVKKGMPGIVTTSAISQAKAIPAFCNISLQESKTGSNITITATVTALIDLTSGSYKLHLALTEQMVSYTTAPGSNGELNFPNVLRKLLPTNGTTLPPLNLGETYSITQTYTIPSYINESQLRTVAIVQENSSKVVIQTFKATNASGENSLAQSISIDLMTATVNPSCSGSNTGSISISLSDGASSLVNYQWSNGATSSMITGLAPGYYSVSVYSDNTNTFLKDHTFQVNSTPSFTVTPNSLNPTCATSNNGSISLTTSASGGIYSYTWSNGQNSATISNLLPGNYSVTVTNSNFPDCPYINTFTLIGPLLPTVTVPAGQTLCNNALTAVIDFTSSMPGVTYNWINNHPEIGLPSSGIGNISPFSAINTGTTPITATITVTPVAADCSGVPQTVTLIVNPSPGMLPIMSQSYCGGESTNPIPLSGTIAGSTFTWTNNNTGIGLSASGSGDLPFFSAINNGANPVIAGISVVPNANGCLGNSYNFNITINPKPYPIVTASSDTTCSGVLVELYATNGTNYMWNNGQTGANISVYPIESTTYTVTASNTYGCTNTSSVHIGVKLIPTATASSNNPCIGNTLILYGGGGLTYEWSGPNEFTSFLQNPVVSTFATPALNGVYSVTVTDADDCTDSASVFVTVISGLTPTITGNTSFCTNSNTVLGLGATYNSYTWSTGATTSTISVNTGGNYSVTVSNSDGCTGSASVALNVFPAPVPNIGSNSPVCAGSAISLNSSGGVSYVWSGPNGFTSNAQNPVLINANSALNGTYLVTVTNAQNCTTSAFTTVQVNQLPIANAGSNNPCLGSLFTLNATGGSSYVWSGPNGFTSTSPNPVVSTEALPGMNGVYTVTVSNTGGCTASASVNVILNSNLSPVISGESILCQGNSTLLNAGSGYSSYTWNTGLNSTTISVTSSGTYTVTVTSTSGCSGSASKTVTVNPSPTATANSNSPVCSGELLNFASSGGLSYQWNGPNSFSSNQQYPVISNTTTNMSGNYTVVTTNSYGCSGSASTNVVIQAPPSANASDNNPCIGGVFILSASGGVNYLWSGPNGFTSNQQNPTVSGSATAGLNGIYTVTVSTLAGCSSVASVDVTITNSLNPVISGNSSICQGSSTILSAGSGFTSYLWSNGSTSMNISVNSAGTYAVTVTNSIGCVGTASKTVTLIAAPLAVANSNSPVCSGNTLNLSSSGGVNYSWTGPNFFTSTQQNPNFSIASSNLTGLYTVIVTNNQGCTATASTSVQVSNSQNAGANNFVTVCNDNLEGTTITNLTSILTGEPGGTFIPIGGAPLLVGGIVFDGHGLLPNTYQYNYTINNPYPCPNSTAIISVIVEDCIFCVSPPSAAFSYVSNSFCTDGNIINPILELGATSGIWTSQTGLAINSVNGSINLNASLPNTYTIFNTIPAADPCPEAIFSTQITITHLPTADAGNDQTICLGQSAILSASGGATYLWSTGQSGSIISVNPIITTTYIVTVTNFNGCSAEDAVIVNVSNLPSANAGTDQTICLGQSTTLSATGGTTYVWSSGQTGANIIVSPVVSTTYTVTVTASNGCSASDAINVSVNSLPVADAGNNQSICPGQSANLSASGGIEYMWSTGQSSAVISVNPISPTTYTVTVFNSNNCSATDQVIVSILPTPIANAGADQSVCLGQSTVLTATGGNSYSWNTGQNSATITVSPIQTTAYGVTVTNSNGCTGSDSVLVTITTPEFTVSGLNGPSPLIVCIDESSYTVFFTINGGSPPFVVNGNQLPFSSNVFTSEVIFTPTYSFIISDNTGCIYQLQGTATCSTACLTPIVVQPALDNGGCIDGFTLVAEPPTDPLPSSNLYSIDGYTFQNDPTFTNLNEGTYQIFVNSDCGVWNIGSFSMPSGTLQIEAVATLQSNGTYLVTAEVSGGTPLYTYLWSNGATGNTAYLSSFNEPITVTVTDKNGCQQTFTLTPTTVVGVQPVNEPIQLSLYPNPSTNGLFYLDVATTLTLYQQSYVTLFDVTGRKLDYFQLPFSFTEKNYELDLQHYDSGIYLVHVQIGNLKYVFKAVVIK